MIQAQNFEQHAATDAILADGSQVTLESFVCYPDWFGTTIAAQVIANDGKVPLLGTELLSDRILRIDDANRRLTLDGFDDSPGVVGSASPVQPSRLRPHSGSSRW